jgi:hypothetical protein
MNVYRGCDSRSLLLVSWASAVNLKPTFQEALDEDVGVDFDIVECGDGSCLNGGASVFCLMPDPKTGPKFECSSLARSSWLLAAPK